MAPFIKFFHEQAICRVTCTTEAIPKSPYDLWFSDSELAYRNLSPLQKCKWLLSQSLFVHYFTLIYNDNPNTPYPDTCKSITIFQQYVAELIDRVKRLRYITEQNKVVDINQTVELCEFLLGVSSNLYSVKYDSVCGILDVPTDVNNTVGLANESFYRPYLYYLLASYSPHPHDNRKFDQCGVPVFHFIADEINVEYIQFPGYEYLDTKLNEAKKVGLQKTVFGFWIGLNMSHINMTQLFGFLASHAIFMDISQIPSGSMNMLWYELFVTTFGIKANTNTSAQWCDPLGRLNERTSEALNELYNQLHYFLLTQRETNNVVFDDRSALAHIIVKLTSIVQPSKIVAYLESDTASNISAEALHEFNSSIYAKFPELFQNQAKSDRSKSNSSQDKNDTTSNDDSVTSGDNTHTNTPPDTNEQSDFVLEIDQSPETPQSFMFRLAVGNQIDAILEDPPSSISSNDRLLLKKLRVYWLYLINVQTIYRIVSSIFKIKLPTTLQ